MGDRYYNGEGEVAVLVSIDFGAGWSTWNDDLGEELLFDPGLVRLVLDGKVGADLNDYAGNKWPSAYLGGLDGLEVEWLPRGTAFCIHEYDGSESVEERDSMDWVVA